MLLPRTLVTGAAGAVGTTAVRMLTGTEAIL
jgi:NADPH:quinone reductase-like Zn-dependent oxidoreductase